MRKRSKIIFAVIILLISAGAVFMILFQKGIIPGKGGRPGAEAQEDVRFPVETVKSRRDSITDYFRINGNVIPAKSIDIFPDMAGRLVKTNISIGDYVKKNDVIAEVDPSRPGQVFTPGPVRSTINGTVTAINFEQGSTVSVSTPIATIGDLSVLQIEAEISEYEVSMVTKGTAAEVTFVAYPERKYSARVIELSPVVNRITRTMKIKLEFTGNYPEIKAGMFASIRLFTRTSTDAVIVPSEAVITRDGKSFVFTVDSTMKAVMSEVVTGISIDGRTEIIKGITEGEDVVTRGQTLLDDGAGVIIPENGRG